MLESRCNLMPDDVMEIRQSLATLNQRMSEVQVDVAQIKTMVETEGARCIYRERIDAAYQLVGRVGKLEDRLVQLEVKVAGIAALIGIAVSVITTIIINAVK